MFDKENAVTIRIYHTCNDEYEIESCKACFHEAAYAKWLKEQEENEQD